MVWSLTSPVAGAAISGLTSPTYTLAVDTAPSPFGKQYYVSALGGTQTGATAHSPTKPFTATLTRPQQVRTAAPARTNSNALVANVRNKWVMVIRKGGLVNASLAIPGLMVNRDEIDIAAGMEDSSPVEIAAFVSFKAGCWWNNAQAFSDSFRTGTI